MRKSLRKSSDRISELPDPVLDSILCLLPKKYAIRTSLLSRRWTNLWESTWIHATCFDFGKEFAQSQTQQQFAASVNKYLHLHIGHNIDKFLLYFTPGEYYRADVEKWIEFATSKGVKKLDLTLCWVTENSFMEIPAIFFSCNSFVKLCLSRINFNPSPGFTGFGSLQTLRLNQVSITGETLESLISNCPSLTNLRLRLCSELGSIRVSSMNLRCLSVIATDAYEIDIFAPNLKSLHFYGDILYGYTYQDVAALEDFFISAYDCEHTEPEHDFIQILSDVSHVKILTTCTGAPMYITSAEEYGLGPLPIILPNLQELQILIGVELVEEYLNMVFNFFKHIVCPCLEKIFIDLPDTYIPMPVRPYHVDQAEMPLGCVFNNLQTVKINQFRGSDAEMKLVRFFLQRACALELMVIIAASDLPQENDANIARAADTTSHSERSEKSMKLLLDELALLPRLSSNVQILLFDNEDVGTSLTPVHKHTDYYLDYLDDTLST